MDIKKVQMTVGTLSQIVLGVSVVASAATSYAMLSQRVSALESDRVQLTSAIHKLQEHRDSTIDRLARIEESNKAIVLGIDELRRAIERK